MQLTDYYQEENGYVSVSRSQASNFAKKVADDFNPIHDADAKKFIVPGDLLFAISLHKFGLCQKMHFHFAGMVNDDVRLKFNADQGSNLSIISDKDKEYLRIQRSGESISNTSTINKLITSYVTFSGHAFVHQLVPLMKQHNVMINPARPLVIYESMEINLNTLEFDELAMELSNSNLEIDGKRGNVVLKFDLKSAGELIGTGQKNMVLSGLRPLDLELINGLVERYSERKKASL